MLGSTLDGWFRDTVGISPKTLEEIRKRLMFDPDQSLTMLAHEFGYTDQAHFIDDFREYADRTPGELARQMRAVQDIFRNHDNGGFLQVPSRRRSWTGGLTGHKRRATTMNKVKIISLLVDRAMSARCVGIVR